MNSNRARALLITCAAWLLTSVVPARAAAPFEARDKDVIVLKNGRRIYGQIVSEPGDNRVRIIVQADFGEIGQAYKRGEIRKILPQQTRQQAFRGALKAAGENPVQLLAIARHCVSLKMHDEGIQAARAAQRARPHAHQAILLEAELHERQSNLGAALDALTRAQRLRPADPKILSLKATVLLGLNKPQEALMLAESLLAKPAASSSMRLAAARVLLVVGEFARARRQIEKILLREPNHRDALLALGRLLLATSEAAAAETAFTRALAVDRTSVAAIVGLGNSLLLLGRNEEATAEFKSALRYSGMQSNEAFLGLGLISLAQGDVDTAATHLQAAAGQSTHLGRAHIALGYLEDRAGRRGNALIHYALAAKKSPTDAYSHYVKGYAYYRQAKWTEAAAAFSEARRRAPRAAPAWQAFGAALLSAGQYAEAAATYRQALAVAVDSPADLHSGLGLAYLGRKQPDQARRALQKALELDSGNVQALLGLGYLANQDEREGEATRYFRDTLRVDGANAYAIDALQKIYAQRDEQLTYYGFSGAGTGTGMSGFRLKGGQLGLTATVGGGKLLISGTMKANRGRYVRALVDVPVSEFRRIEADVDVAADTPSEAGIFLYLRRAGEIRVGKNQAGKLFVQSRGRGAPMPEQILGDWPGSARLSIELVDRAAGSFAIRVGLGAPTIVVVSELNVTQGQYETGIFVTTDRDQEVLVKGDNIIITRRIAPAP